LIQGFKNDWQETGRFKLHWFERVSSFSESSGIPWMHSSTLAVHCGNRVMGM